MDANRWREIERLCQAALERPENQRAAFLDQACAGDNALRDEVKSLLAQGRKVSGRAERCQVSFFRPAEVLEDHVLLFAD